MPALGLLAAFDGQLATLAGPLELARPAISTCRHRRTERRRRCAAIVGPGSDAQHTSRKTMPG